ncbi:MAG: hypothetical protein JWN68_2325 [Nocardioides sp.]|jgi:hypothetical protein|uniref:hypothetical protein n=1 Tax=Nocardioides sp. TaxID=35761 RepID=UPI00260530C0|nr:hypothetical protein [Nocardioides sp.]MCW2834372.1 hypothetical protein [Nocardioides sp.]
MDREHLLAALARADAGDATDLCRQAVLEGAELDVAPMSVPTAALRGIYRSRAEHLLEHEVAAVGAHDAADRLDRTSHASLRIGSVAGGRGHFFQLFLDPAGQELVACLMVPVRGHEAHDS